MSVRGLGLTNGELRNTTWLYYDSLLGQNRIISALLQQIFELGPTYAEFGKLNLIL